MFCRVVLNDEGNDIFSGLKVWLLACSIKQRLWLIGDPLSRILSRQRFGCVNRQCPLSRVLNVWQSSIVFNSKFCRYLDAHECIFRDEKVML